MKVLLRNPRREVEVEGPLRVHVLLERLGVNREAVLVIRGDTLVTGDALLADEDTVEVRPVVSGGALAPDVDARPTPRRAATPVPAPAPVLGHRW